MELPVRNATSPNSRDQKYTTAQKMKFSIKDFFSKCDQIRSFLRIWSHLLKKSLIENFIFCAVYRCWLKRNLYQWRVGMLFIIFYTIYFKSGCTLIRLNFTRISCEFNFANKMKFFQRVFIFLSFLKFFSFFRGFNFWMGELAIFRVD